MSHYEPEFYFEPFMADDFALFLGAIHFIFIMLIYLVIYGFLTVISNYYVTYIKGHKD